MTAGNGAPRAAASTAPLPLIVGPENRLLATAIPSFVQAPHAIDGPLVIYGPAGVGKSHLAAGLAAAWLAHDDRPVMIVPAAEFAKAYLAAISSNSVGALREGYLAAGLFILEDLTHLATKPSTLGQVLLLIDELAAAGIPLLVTSRVAPHQISKLSDALLGRLAAGLTLPLAAPGPEARLAILEQYAQAHGIPLARDCARLIAETVDGTGKDVLDVFASLEKDRSLLTAELGLETLRRILADGESATELDLRHITAVTAKYFGLKPADMTSPSRRRAVVFARGVAMYLARELTKKSLTQVGEHFGGRDHTTVMHSCRNTEQRLQADPVTKRAVTDLRKTLALR